MKTKTALRTALLTLAAAAIGQSQTTATFIPTGATTACPAVIVTPVAPCLTAPGPNPYPYWISVASASSATLYEYSVAVNTATGSPRVYHGFWKRVDNPEGYTEIVIQVGELLDYKSAVVTITEYWPGAVTAHYQETRR